MKKIFIFLIILTIFSSCKKEELVPTEDPIFSPTPGRYEAPIFVKIDCETFGAKIYYTTDGNDPSNSSNIYTSSILLNKTTIVKAIAIKEGMKESPIASATYTIDTRIEWQLLLGGERGNRKLLSLKQLSDGGYIIIGKFYVEPSTAGTYIYKIDSSGELEWDKVIKDNGFLGVSSNTAQATSDGGYILGKTIGHNFNIIKFNSDLEIEWQKSFGSDNDETIFYIQQTSDGGYIVGGMSKRGTSDYFYVVKIKSNGDSEWQKTFGEGEAEWFESIIQTNDGGYILTGQIYEGNSVRECDVDGYCYNIANVLPYVIKIDAGGSLEWQKSFGDNRDKIKSLEQTKDGGYVFVVNAEYGNLLQGSYIVKLNSRGNKEWGNFNDKYNCEFNSVQQTNDEGFILGGLCGGHYCVMLKTNSSGIEEWQESNGGSGYDECNIIIQTSDGGYIAGGRSQSDDIPGAVYNGSMDYFYIIKLMAD